MKTRRPSAGSTKPAAGGTVARLFEKEEKRIEKKRDGQFMPFRFWLPKGEGEEIIILDMSLEDGLAIREHNLQGSDGKYGNYERCLADTGIECPVCKKYGSDSYLVLLLSIIVKREWTSKKTGETHPYSKMLLAIKRGQFAKFRKLEAIAQKKHGTLRGVMFYMERGTDDQSFSSGEPVPLDDGSAFDYYTEDELIEEFGHKAIKGRDNKILKEANEDTKPFDYLKLFPEPEAKELRERHGVEPEPGSSEANDAEQAEDYEEEHGEDDQIPMTHSFADKGRSADGEGDQSLDPEDAATELEEKAEELDLDPDAFPTWEALGVAIDEALLPKAATKKAAKKAPRKRTRPSPRQEDGGGDVDEW